MLDTETYYDREVSITTLGNYHYTRHEKTRAYLCSVVAGNQQYVGSVDDFDWAAVAGPNFQWWAFNASFDMQVYMRLHEENPTGFPLPTNPMMCASDLCAYLGMPRNLAGAVFAAFGEVLSKSVRDNMKGRMPADLDEQGRADLVAYALADSVWALKLVEKYAAQWPECERRFSLLTRKMGWTGLAFDIEGAEKDIANLKQQIWEARQQIPWANEAAALSPKQLALKCREVGIPAPASLAMDSDECSEWEDKYGDQYPWVNSMRTVRRCNALLKKMETMAARVMPNGRMSFGVKYCGAITRRDSGEGGVNMLNLNSKEMFGVDLRSKIIAAPGKKLIVADQSQIEARVSDYLVGNRGALAQMASGISPYYIHAAETMGMDLNNPWPKTSLDYKLCKARRLGLGFGCGHKKFLWMATNLYDAGAVFDREVSSQEITGYVNSIGEYDPAWLKEWKALPEQERNRFVVSKVVVDDFRATNPLITGMWRKLGDAAKEAAARRESLVMTLPSGNTIVYNDVRYRGKELVGRIVKFGVLSEVKIYGGLLFENCIAGDAEILTDRGPKPLQDLSVNDLVWDGEDFVSHDGLAARGTQDVIPICGIGATEDHLFLTESGWVEASRLYYEDHTSIEPVEAHRPTWEDIREPHCHRKDGQRRQEDSLEGDLQMWKHGSQAIVGNDAINELQQAVPAAPRENYRGTVDSWYVPPPRFRGLEINGGSLHFAHSQSMEELWREGNNSLPRVGRLIRVVLGGNGADLCGRTGPRSGGQRARLQTRQLPLDNTENKLPEQTIGHREPVSMGSAGLSGARQSGWNRPDNNILPPKQRLHPPGRSVRTAVFDILNCGPRHRFAIRIPGTNQYLIAHNCVQGTARDSFRDAVLRVDDAGYFANLRVYDELVTEVDEATAEEDKVEIERLMGISPTWAPSLPVAAEAQIVDHYCK